MSMKPGRPEGYGTQGLRLCRLLDELRAKPGEWVQLADLAARYGVTRRTIARDLNALATVYPVRREFNTAGDPAGRFSAVWFEAGGRR